MPSANYKPIDSCSGHRTKAEIAQRKSAEAAALTGIKMREQPEIKADPIAHAEYLRVVKILSAIGKNDALYESVINEYCQLKSDIDRYVQMRKRVEDDTELSGKEYYKLVIDIDGKINAYKSRRFNIEKENGMTIASSMRAIPKKVEKEPNPLMEALKDD